MIGGGHGKGQVIGLRLTAGATRRQQIGEDEDDEIGAARYVHTGTGRCSQEYLPRSHRTRTPSPPRGLSRFRGCRITTSDECRDLPKGLAAGASDQPALGLGARAVGPAQHHAEELRQPAATQGSTKGFGLNFARPASTGIVAGFPACATDRQGA